MSSSTLVVWDDVFGDYDFGPTHPLRVALEVALQYRPRFERLQSRPSGPESGAVRVFPESQVSRSEPHEMRKHP